MIETTEAHAPLVQRLAREFGATWVDETSVADWSAGGGDRVVLLEYLAAEHAYRIITEEEFRGV